MAIPEPYIESIDFKFNLYERINNKHVINDIGKLLSLEHDDNHNIDNSKERKKEIEFKFKSIRVEYPTVLVVNGKKWTKEKVSTAFFVPKVIAD